MELPQVARYTDSQRYVEHYDGVDPNTDAGRAFCSNGGQRVATVLCYLNDVAEGGGTAFRCVRCILHACNSEKQRRRVRADPCFASLLLCAHRRVNFEIRPKKGNALIFFPGFMNGQLDTEALHAGMPAIDTKWVSQVWIRQTFREDGQPSVPVPDSERTLVGPLHKGFYRGHCLAGDDVHEEVMTVEQAKEFAQTLPNCYGFTFNSADRNHQGPIRIWFKSKLNVLYNESWWTWSTGLGMD